MNQQGLVHPDMLRQLVASGQFARTVRIEQPVQARTASGQVVTTWQTVPGLDNVPAARARLRAQEIRQPELTEELIRHRWVLAGYFPEVTDAMRMIDTEDDSLAWNITSVESDTLKTLTLIEGRLMVPEAVPGQ